jgi:hypothetical protein
MAANRRISPPAAKNQAWGAWNGARVRIFDFSAVVAPDDFDGKEFGTGQNGLSGHQLRAAELFAWG